MEIAVRHGSQLRRGGVVVDEPGIMRDGHASRGDIDDDLSVGALAIFPATMMVADGIFSKRRQGVLQLQCGTANVSTIVDGVMVAQHRRQFPDRLAAIGGDIGSDGHTSERQSLIGNSYAALCLKKK